VPGWGNGAVLYGGYVSEVHPKDAKVGVRSSTGKNMGSGTRRQGLTAPFPGHAAVVDLTDCAQVEGSIASLTQGNRFFCAKAVYI